MAKRFYWLQLKEDFFRQKEIKMLRKIAGGDTYTVIYLKMMLMSLKDEGKILYEGVGADLAEEVALEIDEDVENVKITINYLMAKNLMTTSDYDGLMKDVPNLIGSESDSAKRVRKHREIKDREQKTLQCNGDVTNGNTEIEIELELELDIELEKEKEITKPVSSKKDSMDTLFSDIWKLYPKRTMKKEALAAFNKSVKSGTDVEVIKQGVINYVAHLQENKSWLEPMDGGRWFKKERWNDEYNSKGKVVNPYAEELGF